MTSDRQDGDPADKGFIFATTGAGYTALATQSATRLKAHAPDIPIDLFTDQAGVSGPFQQVHQIERWFRPKFEALMRTRFARAVYLDADTWVVADPSDIFDVLERFDLAMAHDPYRAVEHTMTPWRTQLPAAFPQLNSGVIGQRKSPATDALWAALIAAIKADDLPRDQGVLRELLFQSDLRIATLPEEYNLMGLRALNIMSSDTTAPRILHSPRLHGNIDKGRSEITDLRELVGRPAADQINRLVKNDPTLGGSGARVRPLIRRGLMELLSIPLGLVRGRFRK